MQGEIKPQVLRELLTSWSSSQEFQNSFQKTWDTMHTLASQVKDEEAFYNEMQKQDKGGGSLATQANIIQVAVDGDFNYDKAWKDVEIGQRTKFKEFYEHVRDSGSLSEGTLQKIAEAFTGQREVSKVTAQNLQIYRISSTNIERELIAIADIITSLPLEVQSRTQWLDLKGPNTKIPVDLGNLVGELTGPVAKELAADKSFQQSVKGEKGDPGPTSQKLCSAISSAGWRDTIRVNDAGWNYATCLGWANSVRAERYSMACFSGNQVVWGSIASVEKKEKATTPYPNCGWQ